MLSNDGADTNVPKDEYQSPPKLLYCSVNEQRRPSMLMVLEVLLSN